MVMRLNALPAVNGGGFMMAGPFNDLYKTARTILDKTVETFAQAGVSLPDRQYVTAGTPAQDCEQVTVAFQTLTLGTPGNDQTLPSACDGPRSAAFQVVITRCIPVVGERDNKPPAPRAIEDAGHVLMRDAELLLDMTKAVSDYLGVIASVEASEAEGGLQSAVLILTIGVS